MGWEEGGDLGRVGAEEGNMTKNMWYESLEELIKNTYMYCVYGVCILCVCKSLHH